MRIIDYKELTLELARKGCFVLNMPNEDYHAYAGISKSGLDLVDKSPAHYLMSATRPTKAPMRMGAIVHTALLEPERFANDYMILRDINDKRKTEYKQAVKVYGDDNVLIAKEAAQIESMQATLQATPEAQAPIDDAEYIEVSAFVEIDGVLYRCRYDGLNITKRKAFDLKTTQCSKREEFAKSVYNYRYHVQDAFYGKIFEEITGEPLDKFEFLAVENDPPHCPMVYSLSEEARTIGAFQAAQNIMAFRGALLNQDWHGYEQTNEPLELPSWAIAQHEQAVEDAIT